MRWSRCRTPRNAAPTRRTPSSSGARPISCNPAPARPTRCVLVDRPELRLYGALFHVGTCHRTLRVCWEAVELRCRKYIDAEFLPATGGVYDFISVDGRARVHCLKRALPLLKPEGGILMLVCTCCATDAGSWSSVGMCAAADDAEPCARRCAVRSRRTTQSGSGMQMHLQQCQSTGSNSRTTSTQVISSVLQLPSLFGSQCMSC